MRLKLYVILHNLVSSLALRFYYVFTNLSEDIEHRKEHIAKEGLHVLIGVLDSSNEELQFWTAQTIQNLCTGTLFLPSLSRFFNILSRIGQSAKSC